MVCSNWAALPLSVMTAVQPSSRISTSSLPCAITGSMVKVMPGCISPGTKLSVVVAVAGEKNGQSIDDG